MKCASCSGPHNANSRDCPLIQKAYKLEKEKVLNKYNKKSTKRPSILITESSNWPNLDNSGRPRRSQEQQETGPLYSHVVAGPSGRVQNKCSCSCGGSSNFGAWPNIDFYEKLKKFVLEIISMVSTGESVAAKSLLATSAIRNNFGIDLMKQKNATEGDSCSVVVDPKRKRPLDSPDGNQSEKENEHDIASDEDILVDKSFTLNKRPKGKKKKKKESTQEIHFKQ